MNKTADFFDDMAMRFGVPVKMPRPGRAARKWSAVTNGIVGTGLIVAGAVVPSKVLICLGIIGTIGAVTLAALK